MQTTNTITPETALTLDGLFRERVKRSPSNTAYKYFDQKKLKWKSITWLEMSEEVSRWQVSLKKEKLEPGDRVAVMMENSIHWIMFDQAALGLGLVVIPLFCNDRSENISYILQNGDVKFLLINGEEQWKQLITVVDHIKTLKRIVYISPVENKKEHLLLDVKEWLSDKGNGLNKSDNKKDDLATIVYTSGTTGRPKGVKLSHYNILWNAVSGLKVVNIFEEDIFLSFLPLCHTFERTIGYYLPIMSGSSVAFARSIPLLSEDLVNVKPTVLISVPRIFERVYAKVKGQLSEKSSIARKLFNLTVNVGWARFNFLQKREKWSVSFLLWPVLDRVIASKIKQKLGGRLRVTICGGAALSPDVSRLFIGLGVPLLQGYGMTETSPVISVNLADNNDPASVGLPFEGIKLKIGKDDELLVKGPGVMLGYWKNEEATSRIIDEDGWLHTGDKVKIIKSKIYITGRIKEIIVLSNGEKVPPSEIESSIGMDPLFDQVIVIGEGYPYLSAIIVINMEECEKLSKELGLNYDFDTILESEKLKETALERVSNRMKQFPGFAQVHGVCLTSEPWTVESNLLTPTLKIRRDRIVKKYSKEVDKLYEGHSVKEK